MPLNLINNSLIILPNTAKPSSGALLHTIGTTTENNRVVESANSVPVKPKIVNGRVEVNQAYNNVIFSRSEKAATNTLVGQYVVTENLVKRDEIQSLIGLDLYV